ncbi:hypothetical protein [Bombilactobacillus folatiphilus]
MIAFGTLVATIMNHK